MSLNLGLKLKTSEATGSEAVAEPIVMKHTNFNVGITPAVAAPPPETIATDEQFTPLAELKTADTTLVYPQLQTRLVAYFFCPSLPSLSFHIPGNDRMGISKTIKFEHGVYATDDPHIIRIIRDTANNSNLMIRETDRIQYLQTLGANQGIEATMQGAARKYANSDAVRGVRNHNFMEQRAAAAGITPTEEERKQYTEATRAGDFGGSFGGTPAAPRK